MWYDGIIGREFTMHDKSLYGFEVRPDIKDRRLTGKKKRYEIEKLWQRSHEMIGMSLSGMSNADIAKVLGVSARCVQGHLNSELGMKKMSDMRRERDDKFVELSALIKDTVVKGVRTYASLLDRPDVNLELKKEVADTVVLELGGLRAPERSESRNFYASATAEDLDKFKEQAMKAAEETGKLVNITPVIEHKDD